MCEDTWYTTAVHTKDIEDVVRVELQLEAPQKMLMGAVDSYDIHGLNLYQVFREMLS